MRWRILSSFHFVQWKIKLLIIWIIFNKQFLQLYFIYFLLFRLTVLWLSSLSILFGHSVHCFTPLALTLLKAKIKAIQICNYYKSKFSFNVLKQSNHGGAIWNGFFFFSLIDRKKYSQFPIVSWKAGSRDHDATTRDASCNKRYSLWFQLFHSYRCFIRVSDVFRTKRTFAILVHDFSTS